MSARRVLMLAYYFPPLGGGGVQRTLKFVEMLPEFGYVPVVVTGPIDRTLKWAPDDHTLAASLPPGTEVIRARGPEPPRTRARSRGERWLRIPSPRTRWWIDESVAAAREAARTVDVIYATMSPFGSGEAAMRLALQTGRPWIADLRDPWALDEWLVYPTALHRRLELRRMRRVLSTAAAIVMNTREAGIQLLRHVPELRDRPVVTIPNGFDPADFDGPPPARADDAFRIVHAGWAHTAGGRRHRRLRVVRRLLGGSVRGLDIITRSDVYLLQATERLLEARPELRSEVEVHLAGQASGDERGQVVHAHGYLPHPEMVSLLRSADLLFLPMHDLPVGTRARIVPGKTYEYLAAQRPILGAVPDGDARDLLLAAGNATVVRPADVDAMASAIGTMVDRRRAGEATPAPDPEVLSRYERRRLTGELAQVLDGALDQAPAARELVL